MLAAKLAAIVREGYRDGCDPDQLLLGHTLALTDITRFYLRAVLRVRFVGSNALLEMAGKAGRPEGRGKRMIRGNLRRARRIHQACRSLCIGINLARFSPVVVRSFQIFGHGGMRVWTPSMPKGTGRRWCVPSTP